MPTVLLHLHVYNVLTLRYKKMPQNQIIYSSSFGKNANVATAKELDP